MILNILSNSFKSIVFIKIFTAMETNQQLSKSISSESFWLNVAIVFSIIFVLFCPSMYASDGQSGVLLKGETSKNYIYKSLGFRSMNLPSYNHKVLMKQVLYKYCFVSKLLNSSEDDIVNHTQELQFVLPKFQISGYTNEMDIQNPKKFVLIKRYY
jgi:hypothetical protein